MKIEHTSLTDKIHLLTFETQEELSSTFLRFQEHYESPEFKGRIFSLDEYKEWYIKNSPTGKETGQFTYYDDWAGFNIPSSVLKPFYEGLFDPLSDPEKEILNIFKDEKDPFYIIGIYKESKDIDELLDHEIAHGLFSTNPEYKREVQSVLLKFDFELLKHELRSNSGYHEDVLEDEVHAYVLEKDSRFKDLIPEEAGKELRRIYEKYYNKFA